MEQGRDISDGESIFFSALVNKRQNVEEDPHAHTIPTHILCEEPFPCIVYLLSATMFGPILTRSSFFSNLIVLHHHLSIRSLH